jgi:NADH:ubiquinone oxidoreductase subunit 5 (subunit L)/multisubunit Na+/H+ antiporter MnhA subunit
MNLLVLTVFFPLIASLALLCLPKEKKPLAAVSVLGLGLGFNLLCFFKYLKAGSFSYHSRINQWLALYFVGDGLALFMALVSSLVALLICLYALDYMRHYENRGEFYFWTVLFIGSMQGLIFSANLILLFCFWELTSLCSWRLIGFYRQENCLKAADKAFLITFFGASLMLAGFILIYLNYGTLDLPLLKGIVLNLPVSFLLLAGIISKSAQLPLETWLPDAGLAPTPVTALLHAAVLVKIGIYVFARLFCLTFAGQEVFLKAVIALSAATIIVGAGSALAEKDLKHILAYSTISQLGYILLALSLDSQTALRVALTYILAHSLAKAGLFLCAGIIEQKSGTKEITRLGGLLKLMPYTATAYLLCAFSVVGIAPFLGFWPKLMTVFLVLRSGHLLAGLLAVAGAVFTLFYLLRIFNRVFLGELQLVAGEDRKSPMVWVALTFGFLSLFLGLGAGPLFNFINLFSR